MTLAVILVVVLLAAAAAAFAGAFDRPRRARRVIVERDPVVTERVVEPYVTERVTERRVDPRY